MLNFIKSLFVKSDGKPTNDNKPTLPEIFSGDKVAKAEEILTRVQAYLNANKSAFSNDNYDLAKEIYDKNSDNVVDLEKFKNNAEENKYYSAAPSKYLLSFYKDNLETFFNKIVEAAPLNLKKKIQDDKDYLTKDFNKIYLNTLESYSFALEKSGYNLDNIKSNVSFSVSIVDQLRRNILDKFIEKGYSFVPEINFKNWDSDDLVINFRDSANIDLNYTNTIFTGVDEQQIKLGSHKSGYVFIPYSLKAVEKANDLSLEDKLKTLFETFSKNDDSNLINKLKDRITYFTSISDIEKDEPTYTKEIIDYINNNINGNFKTFLLSISQKQDKDFIKLAKKVIKNTTNEIQIFNKEILDIDIKFFSKSNYLFPKCKNLKVTENDGSNGSPTNQIFADGNVEIVGESVYTNIRISNFHINGDLSLKKCELNNKQFYFYNNTSTLSYTGNKGIQNSPIKSYGNLAIVGSELTNSTIETNGLLTLSNSTLNADSATADIIVLKNSKVSSNLYCSILSAQGSKFDNMLETKAEILHLNGGSSNLTSSNIKSDLAIINTNLKISGTQLNSEYYLVNYAKNPDLNTSQLQNSGKPANYVMFTAKEKEEFIGKIIQAIDIFKLEHRDLPATTLALLSSPEQVRESESIIDPNAKVVQALR